MSSEPGVSFFDLRAVARYCDSEIYHQYLKAHEKLEELDKRGRVIAVGAEIQPRELALSECKAASVAISSNLLSKLRSGELIAIGFVIGPSGRDLDEPMRRIPDDVLSASDFKIKRRSKTVVGNWLTFGDVRVCAPAEFHESHDDDQTPVPALEKLAPPKGKLGRKPKWDWESANRELIRLANSPDGLPYPQAALERHFADWFTAKFRNCPGESTIRDFIAKRLPPDYR